MPSARRLGPKPPETPSSPGPTQYVTARTKGLQILATLQPATVSTVRAITTPEQYLAMDAKLAIIRNAKQQWKLALAPVSDPLDRAITKQKEALAEAKKAREGVTQLDTEISGKFDQLERHVKELMADYKRAEQRLLAEAAQAQEAEARRLQVEAAKKRLQAASAKSPFTKARLEQEAATAAQQAEAVREETETVAPVKGSSSVSRTTRHVRISDPIAFLKAVTDYEPVGGVYSMGKPPLRTVDKKGEPAFLVDIVSARLNDLYREQPGIVTSWPGVEEFDEITIAGR